MYVKVVTNLWCSRTIHCFLSFELHRVYMEGFVQHLNVFCNSSALCAYLPATHLPLSTLNMTRAAYYLAQQTWWSLWCDRSSRPAPPAPGAAVSSSAGPCPPPRSPPPRLALSCPGPLRVVHSASRWAEPPAPAYSVSGSWWPLVARPAGTAAREACRAGGGASGARGGATHSWDSPAPLL